MIIGPLYYWIKASYYDPKSGTQRSAFSGWWPTENEAVTWAINHYSAMPGSDFKVIKSKSRDRNVARNEERHNMVESGQDGNIAEVLDIKFSDHNKKEQ